MTERIDDSSEAPTVLVRDRGRLGSPGSDGLINHVIRVVDNQQRSARGAIDGARTQALHTRVGRCHPERGLPDAQLGDDLIATANTVKDRGPEGRLVERDGLIGAVDPQLRLKADPHPMSIAQNVRTLTTLRTP